MRKMENRRKSYFTSRTHRFLPVVAAQDIDSLSTMDSDSAFEFDESEIIYNNSGRATSFEFRNSLHHHPRRASSSSSVNKKPSSSSGAASSVPVNIPDWSKILGDEHRRKNNVIDYDDDEEYNNYDDVERSGRVPPHEFLARTRVASFSVHEGVGRTLKGRDLSTLRNAIWAKTGFQD